MWLCRAMGESAFRFGLLTLPTAVVVGFFSRCRAGLAPEFLPVFPGGAGQLLSDGRDQFYDRHVRDSAEIHSRVDSREILVDRVASGLLIPMSFFPDSVQRVLAWLPFEHIAFTPLQIYLGKLDRAACVACAGDSMVWVIVLLVAAHVWWERAARKITIHGG